MEIISILFFLLVFIASVVHIFFYFPTKKIHAWIKSFFTNACPKASSTLAAASARQVLESSKERKGSSGYKKGELTTVFATFDKNGDEFITKQELRESLKNLGILVTEKEVEELVAKVDANGDGSIDFDEFCMLYEAVIGHQDHGASGGIGEDGKDEVFDEEGNLKEAFDVFDKDKDGLISVEELGFVLSSLGLKEGKKSENCKEMIRRVDSDGDGMVNFDEFRRMMKSGEKLVKVS
ncbi:calmodulin-like protein 3 [Mangifera indica]|uniref:calmodulin-like protein 3 n=1 Tax=Mangifera indica TaxID=29780 RepID=UPI001CFBB6A0|nr:calmodulin-like protein 3 [Mangifera indica]